MCGTGRREQFQRYKENSVKKVICKLMSMCFLAVSLAALGQSGDAMKQDTMRRGDQMKDNMSAESMGKKAVSVSGKISDDGKTFRSDKDSKNWMISNPEAAMGHEGHHVTVKAHVDAAKNEIHITSVRMAKDEMKDTTKKGEMQH